MPARIGRGAALDHPSLTLKKGTLMNTNPVNDAADVMRRIIVDHIVTGRVHPIAAVRRQADALATEMDAAGLNIDHEVNDALGVAR